MGAGGRAATGQEHRDPRIGEQEFENGVEVAHPGGRVPTSRSAVHHGGSATTGCAD